jgi:hypothetical protein
MAEKKNDTNAENETKTSDAKASSSAKASEMRGRIVKPGEKAVDIASSANYPPQRDGTYEVAHGSLNLGWDYSAPSPVAIVATRGAHVQLSGDEAAPLVAAGTVRHLG